MHVSVRIRIFLARHGWVRWAVALLLAVGVASLSLRQSAAVERERASWGTTVDVLVADGDHRPGDPVDASLVALPAAMVPRTALTVLADGARVRQSVPDGGVLTDGDVTAAGGPAAFADPGTVVVGVRDPLAHGASTGVRVRLASDGIVLATDATVVGADDDVIMVAVPESAAPMVAAAAQIGAVSVLFVP